MPPEILLGDFMLRCVEFFMCSAVGAAHVWLTCVPNAEACRFAARCDLRSQAAGFGGPVCALPLPALPQDYPNKAPVVKFRTRMFHPNSEPWHRKLGSHSFAGS